MEMLEFLASFEDEDTGWTDPSDIMEMTEIDDDTAKKGETDDDNTQEDSNEQ